MVGGVITAAIVALGGVLVAIVNSRSNRTTPSPPAPSTSADEHVLYERTAVLSSRADDSDSRFEVLDRRVDRIERVLDITNEEWRSL